MFLDPPAVTGRRRAAATGALHAVVAWPLLAIAETVIGVVALVVTSTPGSDNGNNILWMLLMAPLTWGLYLWPVVVAVAAAVASMNPGGRSARTAWIITTVTVLLIPFGFFVALSL